MYMGLLQRILNLTVEKYGTVVGGDYKNCPVACDGKRIIFHQKENYCFTKKDVESYSVSDVTESGGTVTINFKDGKKSLLNVNHKGIDYINSILF